MHLDLTYKNGQHAVHSIKKTADGALQVYAPAGLTDETKFLNFVTSLFPPTCKVASVKTSLWSAGGSAYAGGSVGTMASFTFKGKDDRKQVVSALNEVSRLQWVDSLEKREAALALVNDAWKVAGISNPGKERKWYTPRNENEDNKVEAFKSALLSMGFKIKKDKYAKEYEQELVKGGVTVKYSARALNGYSAIVSIL